MAKEIELQNGMKAIVDDEDFERVNQFNWSILQHNETTFSVSRTTRKRNQKLSYFILNLESVKSVVTHKNKDYLDFRKSNLEVTNRKKLSQTSRGCRNASSKYKGVSWCNASRKWKSQIQVNGERIYLGIRSAEEEAALLYNDAARKYFGDHAYQNIIGKDNSSIVIDIPKKDKVLRTTKKLKKSKYRGVSRHRENWSAQIQGKRIGSYKTEKEAALAYNKAAIEAFGDKAILNDLEGLDESVTSN